MDDQEHAEETSSDSEGRFRTLFKKSRRDFLTALSSGFVGALALATSTYNVYLQRQQIRAQVWPRLEYNVAIDREEGFFIRLANNGVGSAQIERVRVLVDGEPVADWLDAEQKLLRRERVGFETVEELADKVMAPGARSSLFVAKTDPYGLSLLAERRRLEVEICYCSSLGECWSLDAPGTSRPKTAPVSACPPDPKPFVALSEGLLDRIAHGGFGDGGARDQAPDAAGDP